jgi:multicomponent Na+:H+ antiporter subunit E
MSAVRVPRSARVLTIAWLTAVWVALWEDLSAANLLAGLALATGLVVLFPLSPPGVAGTLRPAAAARFALYFAWKLVEASLVVAWEVVTPRNRINQGIVAVPIQGVSDTLTTLVANAISLTPGTLTIEIRRRPTILYVHVLHLQDIEAVRREVQHLEVLAIRAFGSARAVDLAEAQLDDAAAGADAAVAPVSGGPKDRM